jgi:hypothetical protein
VLDFSIGISLSSEKAWTFMNGEIAWKTDGVLYAAVLSDGHGKCCGQSGLQEWLMDLLVQSAYHRHLHQHQVVAILDG